MQAISLKKNIYLIGIFFALCVSNSSVSSWVTHGFYEDYHAAWDSNHYARSFLGEFGPIISDYLFIAADHYWHDGRWYLFPPCYELILKIQPAFLEAWSMLGWFYAFNSFEELEDEAAKETVALKGISVLNRGLKYHPDNHKLYFDKAWIYYQKLGDLEKARDPILKAIDYESPPYVKRLAAIIMNRLGEEDRAEEIIHAYEEQVEALKDVPVTSYTFEEHDHDHGHHH